MYEELEQYIRRINMFRCDDERARVQYPPKDQSDVQAIVWELEGDLSPENFACDGELNDDELQAKRVHFDYIIMALKIYDQYGLLKEAGIA